MFMFTMKGRVQHWEHEGRRGMILARTRDDARAVAMWFQENGKGNAATAELGTVQGESLDDQLNVSLEYGSTCAFIWRVVNDEIEAEVFTPEGN